MTLKLCRIHQRNHRRAGAEQSFRTDLKVPIRQGIMHIQRQPTKS